MRFWLLPVWLGCVAEEPDPKPFVVQSEDPGPTWTEVVPILSRCATCHNHSGLTFPITGYEEAAALAPIISSVLATGQMPPWLAGVTADVTYLDNPSLDYAELATVVAWADRGAPLGDADPDVALVGPAPDHLARVDAVVTMAEPYVPAGTPEDHRCFLLDRGDLGDVWVTGIEILPGNLAAAHHMTVLSIIPNDPANSPATADAASPGPGFDCAEITPESLGEYQPIGGWLPGRGAVTYPEGSGVFLPGDATILLKAHYFTPVPDPIPDLTQVHLMTEATVSVKAAELKVNNGLWTRHRSIAVPAGESATHSMTTTVRTEAAQMADIDPTRGLRVHWVLLHMHQLGESARLQVIRGDEKFVLLDIPRWDFDWQLEYWLAEPFVLEADDDLQLQCHHTNPTTEDVWWGELSTEEMCTARMLVSEPPEWVAD